jgi:hypothetical protein
MQRRSRICGELWGRLSEGKSGSDGALSIMLMRLGIAKIGENAVTHVFGDETAVALDQLRAAAVIGGDDAPQVFGIELS